MYMWKIIDVYVYLCFLRIFICCIVKLKIKVYVKYEDNRSVKSVKKILCGIRNNNNNKRKIDVI